MRSGDDGEEDPAIAARRPWLSPLSALALVALSLGLTSALVELFLRRGLGAYAAPSLHVVAVFVAYDMAVGAAVLIAASRRFAAERSLALVSAEPPAASVLVAAYQEAGSIVATVRALAAQTGLVFDVWVGDDGSTDGTLEALVAAFDLRPASPAQHDGHIGDVELHVVRLAHRGKGATLNALASRARHPVLITLDADTRPAASALARLSAAFLDPAVDSAAGMVLVRDPRSWLTGHQAAEYLKTSVTRVGWSALGALEQVPGAFAGLRASSFRAAGGFPLDCLTEDYEMTFRLLDLGLRTGRFPLVVTVPGARVFTDVPDTFAGFVRQRTRWFAGFLSTLIRYRHLLFRPSAQAFGLVRLPLKLFDAILPLVAFTSLVLGVRGGISPLLTVSRVSFGLLVLRWLWDLTLFACALRLSGGFRGRGEDGGTDGYRAGIRGWLLTATELFAYAWLRYGAVLRSYLWVLRGVRRWEASREPTQAARSLD